jgi:hypothetical protein
MDSGMISKIQKAKRYAEERDRITFNDFDVTFRGEHDTYKVTYRQGHWACECGFFAQRGVCSHTMALERILMGMLVPEGQVEASQPAPGSEVAAR